MTTASSEKRVMRSVSGDTGIQRHRRFLSCNKWIAHLARLSLSVRQVASFFLQSGRSGFYFAVLKEGEVAAGDSIEALERDEHNISVADVVNLYREDAGNQDLLRRASELPSLPNSWREYFRKRLESGQQMTAQH